MKFGKLSDVSQVDFSLPPLTADVLAQLPGKEGTMPFRALIGAPRWASRSWVGEVYPKGSKPGDYLTHYARAFHTIELNTTHYRIPTAEQASSWRAASHEDFRFCAKVPQIISHHKHLTDCKGEVAAFVQAIRHFDKQLGHTFLQVHESFGPSHLSRLAWFLDMWPSDMPLAVELRHPDVFRGHRLALDFEDLLRQHQVAAVVTDVAGRRDVWHQSFPSPILMLRFVGNGLHPTDYDRLETWLPRLEILIAHGLETLYFFVHQPEDAQVLTFSRHVASRLQTYLGLKVPIPTPPDPTGGQMSLFG